MLFNYKTKRTVSELHVLPAELLMYDLCCPYSSLRSKHFRASLSRKLGREQKKKGMMGEGEGNEGTAITRLETLATQAISILIIRHCKVMF